MCNVYVFNPSLPEQFDEFGFSSVLVRGWVFGQKIGFGMRFFRNPGKNPDFRVLFELSGNVKIW